MKQVLVTKNVAYGTKVGGAAAADPSELAPGAIGIFTIKGVPIGAATSLAGVREFIIAVGAADGPVLTPAIQASNTTRYYAAEYEAGQTKIITVAGTFQFVNNDGSGVAVATYQHVNRGDEAVLRVLDRTSGSIRPDTQSYSVQVIAGDTPTTLLTRLVQTVNIDGDRVVNASISGSNLLLEGKAGVNFDIALDGVLHNGATAVTTQPFRGSTGEYAQVVAQERLSLASTKGVMEQAGGRGATPVSFNATAGSTYDIAFVEAVNRFHQKDGMDATYGRYIPVMIAFDAAFDRTGFEAVLQRLVDVDGTVAAATPDSVD